MTLTNANATHKLDALLGQFSAGTLTPAMRALVSGHLQLCDGNRGFVAALDTLQGSRLCKVEPEAMSGRTEKLAAIFDAQPVDAPVAVSDPVLPAALHRLIGKNLSEIKWRRRLPGIREYRVADEAGGQAVLYWIKAGHKMPFHTHDGSEATLVLTGAFRDAGGQYGRGDVAIADSDINHQPVVEPDGDCICFAVTDAPLRLTGPFGRIVERLFGHRH